MVFTHLGLVWQDQIGGERKPVITFEQFLTTYFRCGTLHFLRTIDHPLAKMFSGNGTMF